MNTRLFEQLAAFTNSHTSLGKGAYLFHKGDRVRSVFIIEEGQVELRRYQQDGAAVVLQRADRRNVLAEASLYSDKYHCDAVAAKPSIVLQVPKVEFQNYLKEDYAFAATWAENLASEILAARQRIEILSRDTVANRLDCWLSWPGNKMPEKGRWKDIAVEICVSPEALYRELAKRKSVVG